MSRMRVLSDAEWTLVEAFMPFGRSRGELSTKVHQVCDGKGRG